MGEFVRVAGTDDVKPGHGLVAEVNGKALAVFNVEGQFHVIDNTCLHRGGPLGDGGLEGCIVVCPWHGWKYDVTTGVSTLNAAVRVACYVTRVEGEEVQVSC